MMRVDISIGSRVRLWVQGRTSPELVEVLALDEHGFPSRVRPDKGPVLSRARVGWSLLVEDSMVMKEPVTP